MKLTPSDKKNAIVALAHSQHVCALELATNTNAQLDNLVTVLQKPYPALKHLVLTTGPHTSDLPDKFLGGSAPCLWELELGGIPFPALPALLSLATSLAKLHLYDIPESSHITPEAMVVSLAGLTSLQSLHIKLRSGRLHPYRQEGIQHVMWTVLPALHCLVFSSESEYLEDFVTQIDTPQVNTLEVYHTYYPSH